jgi:hypothetical protein
MSRAGVPASPSAASIAVYNLIEETVLGSPASSISFTGITTTNTFFLISGYITKDGSGAGIQMRFNNDSGSNYREQQLYANTTTVTAYRRSSATELSVIYSSLAANESASFTSLISKPVSGQAASGIITGPYGTDASSYQNGSQWANTADLINRIDIISSSNNLDTNSSVLIEGAKPV